MQPSDIIRATSAIGKIGAAFYFAPETVAVGDAHGLSGFRFYAVGRGGVLGNVESEVVRSAFGYFHPELFRKLWDSSAAKLAPRDAARMYIGCAQEFGRRTLADVAGLEGFVDAAATVIGAVEGTSLPLFVGVRSEPVPDAATDAAAAAYHQAMVLRELRGSVHLLALTAAGLESHVAHAIRRPDDVGLFGYTEAPVVSDADRAAWERAEALTDDLLAPAYAALTPEQASALIAGTQAIAAALGLPAPTA